MKHKRNINVEVWHKRDFILKFYTVYVGTFIHEFEANPYIKTSKWFLTKGLVCNMEKRNNLNSNKRIHLKS